MPFEFILIVLAILVVVYLVYAVIRGSRRRAKLLRFLVEQKEASLTEVVAVFQGDLSPQQVSHILTLYAEGDDPKIKIFRADGTEVEQIDERYMYTYKIVWIADLA